MRSLMSFQAKRELLLHCSRLGSDTALRTAGQSRSYSMSSFWLRAMTANMQPGSLTAPFRPEQQRLDATRPKVWAYYPRGPLGCVDGRQLHMREASDTFSAGACPFARTAWSPGSVSGHEGRSPEDKPCNSRPVA